MQPLVPTIPMPDWVYDFLQAAGSLADQAVVLPMLASVALLLYATDRRQGAFAWVTAVCATLGVMLLLKLAVLTVSPVGGVGLLQSPSGHVASGIVVYAGIVALLCRPSGFRWVLPVIAAGSLAVVLGFARVAGGYHSSADVLVGILVGTAGLALLLWLLRPVSSPAPALPLLLLVLIVMSSCVGMRMPAEPVIHALGADLRSLVDGR